MAAAHTTVGDAWRVSIADRDDVYFLRLLPQEVTKVESLARDLVFFSMNEIKTEVNCEEVYFSLPIDDCISRFSCVLADESRSRCRSWDDVGSGKMETVSGNNSHTHRSSLETSRSNTSTHSARSEDSWCSASDHDLSSDDESEKSNISLK